MRSLGRSDRQINLNAGAASGIGFDAQSAAELLDHAQGLRQAQT